MRKTWKNIKPHSVASRKKMRKKYGSRCFLDPMRYKYPICNRYNGKEECVGHYAAQYYLNINIGKLKKKKKNKKSTKRIQKYLKIKNKSLKFTKNNCFIQ